MQKLIFLNHSGFLLELEHAILVFDYFTDPASVLGEYESSDKDIYFFVSHMHYDHWNTDILDFIPNGCRHFYIEENCDIPESVFLREHNQDELTRVGAGFECELSMDEQVRTGIAGIRCFGSTDEGVSFLIKTSAGEVFHSGDLNFWDWEEAGKIDKDMEAAYRGELEKLRRYLKGDRVWLAFLPVDLRLGPKAFSGAEVFLEYCQPHYFVPDHLNGGVQLPSQLAAEWKSLGKATHVLSMTTPGQTAILD